MDKTNRISLPESVSTAIVDGENLLRAYREFLGYAVDELAVICGLTSDEIQKIESGYQYGKGYRDRIAKALALPFENLVPGKQPS